MNYTIVTLDAYLVAVFPDGGDIDAAIREFQSKEDWSKTYDREEFDIISGCTLTNELKEGDKLAHLGAGYNYLTDVNGHRYYAAVKRIASRQKPRCRTCANGL
jgi:hypothetical protein